MRMSSFLAAFALACSGIAAYGSTTISVTGQETFASSSQTWDTGSLSITIAGVTETVTYGRYSTAGSVASGLAAAISQDCKNTAFALADSQGNITVSSRNGGADPAVNGSTNSTYGITSFSFSPPPSGGGGGGGGNPPTGGGDSGNPPGGTEPPIVGGPGAPAEASGTVLYAYQVLAGDGTSGYALNGNINAYNDTVDGQWSAGYDTLNRITSATQASTGSSAANVPSTQYFCWIYDSFGNRMLQARAGSSFNGGCSTTAVANENYVAASFSDPVNLNRVTNVSGEAVNLNGTGSWEVGADLAGNTTQDAVNQYVYDGDGRVCATVNSVYGTWTGYLYDAEGNRVAKGTVSPPAGTDPCDATTNNFRRYRGNDRGVRNQWLSDTMIGDQMNLFPIFIKPPRRAGQIRGGYINIDGDIVIPPEFDGVTQFREGLASVQVGAKWGLIDESGVTTVKPFSDRSVSFAEDRGVYSRQEKVGVIVIDVEQY